MMYCNELRLDEENMRIGSPGELLLQWRTILIAIHLRHDQMLHLAQWDYFKDDFTIEPTHAINKAKREIMEDRSQEYQDIE